MGTLTLRGALAGGAGLALGGLLGSRTGAGAAEAPSAGAAQAGSPASVIGGAVASGSWQVVDLHDRGVKHIATDAPSFGAAEDPQAGHVAGLRHGMTWTESAIRLGRLPLRGAFYVCAPYKVQDQQAGIVRAFAFTPQGAPQVADSPPLQL